MKRSPLTDSNRRPPPYHAPEPLRWVATGCRSTCLSRFRGLPTSDRLPPVAPARLHKCSIYCRGIANRQRASGVPAICALGVDPFAVESGFIRVRARLDGTSRQCPKSSSDHLANREGVIRSNAMAHHDDELRPVRRAVRSATRAAPFSGVVSGRSGVWLCSYLDRFVHCHGDRDGDVCGVGRGRWDRQRRRGGVGRTGPTRSGSEQRRARAGTRRRRGVRRRSDHGGGSGPRLRWCRSRVPLACSPATPAGRRSSQR
jgi:hypothetical protein